MSTKMLHVYIHITSEYIQKKNLFGKEKSVGNETNTKKIKNCNTLNKNEKYKQK